MNTATNHQCGHLTESFQKCDTVKQHSENHVTGLGSSTLFESGPCGDKLMSLHFGNEKNGTTHWTACRLPVRTILPTVYSYFSKQCYIESNVLLLMSAFGSLSSITNFE